MIYLKNNTDPQSINIPYSVNPNAPVQKRVQRVKEFTVNQYGQSVIMPDSGYTSMEKVNLTAPVTGDTVIFRPQGIFDYRNTYYASGTPWSALTVDAEQFGNEQYDGGYNYALRNIDAESVQLSVSANGEYDAVIGPGGTGYIKKVIVNVSGGTQEPFFGQVAKVENAYLDYFNIDGDGKTTIEFLVNTTNLSSSGHIELFMVDNSVDNPSRYEIGEPTNLILDAFITTNISGQTKLYINYELNDKTGDEIESEEISVVVNNNDKIMILFNIQYAREDSTYRIIELFVRNNNTNEASRIAMTRWFPAQIRPNYLTLFRHDENPYDPEVGPFYFKSYQVVSNNYVSNNKLVLPRSDGKIWDVTNDTESNIHWVDANGNTGTTFQTLYEWDIQ